MLLGCFLAGAIRLYTVVGTLNLKKLVGKSPRQTGIIVKKEVSKSTKNNDFSMDLPMSSTF